MQLLNILTTFGRQTSTNSIKRNQLPHRHVAAVYHNRPELHETLQFRLELRDIGRAFGRAAVTRGAPLSAQLNQFRQQLVLFRRLAQFLQRRLHQLLRVAQLQCELHPLREKLTERLQQPTSKVEGNRVTWQYSRGRRPPWWRPPSERAVTIERSRRTRRPGCRWWCARHPGGGVRPPRSRCRSWSPRRRRHHRYRPSDIPPRICPLHISEKRKNN